MRGRSAVSVLLTLAGALVVGCGGDDPEDRLREAQRTLAGVRADIMRLRSDVERKAEDLEARRRDLEASRRALRDAELRQAEAESRVDWRGTDPVLFRRVQRRLLEDRDLREVAIQAAVSRGVVTLSGEVSDASLRERALGLAQTTPGVARVEDQIRLAP